ncbi:MAG: tRNA (adenosine(37)-N6)-threonylcarbamoyltransferase complex dimerization subunit type 1 TsaB [Gammaproteobacteria bacterium]|nr:tRNA (adenosine(37)-N6)-threonylcarbamoyltransferase complex dimerization subunit type 1 TsaB [Gammaproteobacteria bacterium]
MKLLAIDTATEACSCALWINGEARDQSVIAPRRHAELILPMADELLAEAGISQTLLDGLAFGCGPGSFTGLRIACGVIQGMAFALDIPVAPVSCLAALAQGLHDEKEATHAAAAIDARMGEVYWGCYRAGREGVMEPESEDRLDRPEAVCLPYPGPWRGTGSGWDRYNEMFGIGKTVFFPERYPLARNILPLALAAFQRGNIVSAENALPVYLRNQVVKKL